MTSSDVVGDGDSDEMDSLRAELSQAKLEVLQLQCVVDAKGREMKLLREALGSEADMVEELVQLRAQVAALRVAAACSGASQAPAPAPAPAPLPADAPAAPAAAGVPAASEAEPAAGGTKAGQAAAGPGSHTPGVEEHGAVAGASAAAEDAGQAWATVGALLSRLQASHTKLLLGAGQGGGGGGGHAGVGARGHLNAAVPPCLFSLSREAEVSGRGGAGGQAAGPPPAAAGQLPPASADQGPAVVVELSVSGVPVCALLPALTQFPGSRLAALMEGIAHTPSESERAAGAPPTSEHPRNSSASPPRAGEAALPRDARGCAFLPYDPWAFLLLVHLLQLRHVLGPEALDLRSALPAAADMASCSCMPGGTSGSGSPGGGGGRGSGLLPPTLAWRLSVLLSLLGPFGQFEEGVLAALRHHVGGFGGAHVGGSRGGFGGRGGGPGPGPSSHFAQEAPGGGGPWREQSHERLPYEQSGYPYQQQQQQQQAGGTGVGGPPGRMLGDSLERVPPSAHSIGDMYSVMQRMSAGE
ncbi:hypothetical protein FOA52_003851 [Chlamydomonas sp. UWO 241]|nr:hypothetical protein FOA52_003851 [Chlamydomonas sp. UWO 241]